MTKLGDEYVNPAVVGPMTDKDADALRKLSEAATQGEWQHHLSHIYGPEPERELIGQFRGTSGAHLAADRDFVITLVNLYRASLTVADGDAEARGYARGIREAADSLTSLATERDAMKLPKAATSIIRQCARRIETILAKLGATDAE